MFATVSMDGEVVEELTLVDSGEDTDQLAGDGVYSLEWFAPEEEGDYVIELAGEQISVTVN